MKNLKFYLVLVLALLGFSTLAFADESLPPFDAVWDENFDGIANGTTTSSRWTLSINQGSFQVNNNRLEFVGVNAGSLGTWASEDIDISNYTNLAISLLVDDNDNNKETSDYVKAFYVLDGGTRVEFGSVTDDITNAVTLSETGLNGSTLRIEVEFKVSYGNESYNIDNISVTGDPASAGDTTPPSVPTGLASSAHTDSSVSLNWNASTDDSGSIASYEVWMNSSLLSNVGNTTSYTATGLSESTAYSFQVRAIDPSGNQSALSSSISVTTDAASSGGGGSTSSPWTESGSNIHYSGSNVGIGISSPGARLDVRGSIISTHDNGNSLRYFASSDGNSYFNFSGGDSNSRLGFQMDGASKMSLTNSGNLGIGTTSPSHKLHVIGDQKIENTNAALVIQGDGTGDNQGSSIEMTSVGATSSNNFKTAKIRMHRGTDGSGRFEIQRTNSSGSYAGNLLRYRDAQGWRFFTAENDASTGTSIRMQINQNGNVGIGTLNPDGWKLAVEGKIRAREIRVDNDAWPDYVFTNGYDLLTLEDVRKFIQQHGHLPNVPTAKEVESEGVELGEINKVLLEKVEELTLYILQIEERIQTLKEKKTK